MDWMCVCVCMCAWVCIELCPLPCPFDIQRKVSWKEHILFVQVYKIHCFFWSWKIFGIYRVTWHHIIGQTVADRASQRQPNMRRYVKTFVVALDWVWCVRARMCVRGIWLDCSGHISTISLFRLWRKSSKRVFRVIEQRRQIKWDAG